MKSRPAWAWFSGALLAAACGGNEPIPASALNDGAPHTVGGRVFLRSAKADPGGTSRGNYEFLVDRDTVWVTPVPERLHELAALYFVVGSTDAPTVLWYADVVDSKIELELERFEGEVRLAVPRSHFQSSAAVTIPLALPDRAKELSVNAANGVALPGNWKPGATEVYCPAADLATELSLFVTDEDAFAVQILRGQPADIRRPMLSPKHLRFVLSWSGYVQTWEAFDLFAVRQGDRFFQLWQDSPTDRHVSLIDGILPLGGSVQSGVRAELIVAERGLERFGTVVADVTNPPEVEWEPDNGPEGLVPVDESAMWVRIAHRALGLKYEKTAGWYRIVVPGEGSSHWRRFRSPETWSARMALQNAHVEMLLDGREYGVGPWGERSAVVTLQPPRAFLLEAGPDLDLSLSGYRVQMARGARPMDPWPTVLSGTWPESRTVSLQLPRAPGLELVMCLSDGKTCRFDTVPIPDTLERLTVSFGR